MEAGMEVYVRVEGEMRREEKKRLIKGIGKRSDDLFS